LPRTHARLDSAGGGGGGSGDGGVNHDSAYGLLGSGHRELAVVVAGKNGDEHVFSLRHGP
jgi:hypothetical protein